MIRYATTVESGSNLYKKMGKIFIELVSMDVITENIITSIISPS